MNESVSASIVLMYPNTICCSASEESFFIRDTLCYFRSHIEVTVVGILGAVIGCVCLSPRGQVDFLHERLSNLYCLWYDVLYMLFPSLSYVCWTSLPTVGLIFLKSFYVTHFHAGFSQKNSRIGLLRILIWFISRPNL